MDAFDESGHSDFRLGVGSDGGIYVHLQPALDIAGEIDTAEGMLIRPTLSLAITQFLGGARPSVTARFAGAPAGIAPFTAGTDLDKTRLDLAAGLEVLARRNLTLAAEVFGSLSDNSESYGGGLKVQWVF
jgi:outer membrane autotransporter protein